MELKHRVVVAALIERESRILALQRPEGKWGAGKWEFPGGKLEIGEDPRAALARECLEELGVPVVVGPPFDVVSHTYPDMEPVIIILFRAGITSGEAKPLEGGVLVWVNPDEAPALDWLEADIPLVQRWVEEVSKW